MGTDSTIFYSGQIGIYSAYFPIRGNELGGADGPLSHHKKNALMSEWVRCAAKSKLNRMGTYSAYFPIRGNELGGADGPLSHQRAVDGTRTRDPRLGKPMLYQLSYYRNVCLGMVNPSSKRQGMPTVAPVPSQSVAYASYRPSASPRAFAYAIYRHRNTLL